MSAAIAAGPPRIVIEQAQLGVVRLVLADLVLAEAERVLRSKLGYGNDDWQTFAALLHEAAAEHATAPERARSSSGDPDDDRILECAVRERVDVLVTSDRRHLLPLGTHRAVRILAPQALLAEVIGQRP